MRESKREREGLSLVLIRAKHNQQYRAAGGMWVRVVGGGGQVVE